MNRRIAALFLFVCMAVISCVTDSREPIGFAASAEATTGRYALYISPAPDGPFPSVLWGEDGSHVATIAYLPNGGNAIVTVTDVPKCSLNSAPSAADFGDLTQGNTNVGVYYPTTDPAIRAPAKFTSRDEMTGAWTGEAYGENAPDGGAFVDVQQTQPDFSGIDPTYGCWIPAATRY